MLWKGKNKYSILHIGENVASVMWMGAVKIYSAIRSCFGGGRWINVNRWSNTEDWKNF